MLAYRAAFYRSPDSPWIVGRVLDYPGANTQGRDLEQARKMLRDALQTLAEVAVEQGEALPRPDPGSADAAAFLIEPIDLALRVLAAGGS